MHTTPVTLLERLRRPDSQTAWRRFVEMYTPFLVAWSRRIGLQEQEVADLVQDVFVLLIRKMPSFEYDKGKGFRGWLRTVTLNQYRTRLRNHQPSVGGPGIDWEELPAAAEVEFWERDYRGYVVKRAMEIMRSDFEDATWKACWECVVNDRSADDVGAELGLSAGAVRAAKFRVLARLRQELDGLLE